MFGLSHDGIAAVLIAAVTLFAGWYFWRTPPNRETKHAPVRQDPLIGPFGMHPETKIVLADLDVNYGIGNIKPSYGDFVIVPFTISGTLEKKLPDGFEIWFISHNQDGARKYWPQGRVTVNGLTFSYEFANEYAAPGVKLLYQLFLADPSGDEMLNTHVARNETAKKYPPLAELPSGVRACSDKMCYKKDAFAKPPETA